MENSKEDFKTQRLKLITEALSEDVVSSAVLKKVIEAVFKVVSDLKNQLEGKIDTKVGVAKTSADTAIEKTISEMDNLEKSLRKEIDACDEKTLTQCKKMCGDIKELVDQLKGEIPEDADFTEVMRMIEEVRGLIPEIEEDTANGIAGTLNTEKEIVEQSVIIGLADDLKKIREEIERRPLGRSGGNPRKSRIRAYSLTSQCNGVTKTFTLPAKTIAISGVFGTQFPVTFDPTDDWTFSGNTLTLGASITAPDTGQTLWVLIETLFLV